MSAQKKKPEQPGTVSEENASPLDFSERMLKPPPFDYAGFLVYVVFLMLFLATTLHGKDSNTYRLAQVRKQRVRLYYCWYGNRVFRKRPAD